MWANKNPGEYLLVQLYFFTHRLVILSKYGCRKDEFIANALEFNVSRVKNRELHLLRNSPIAGAVLEWGKVVAVYTGIRVTRVSAEFVACNDAYFAVWIGAFADELDTGRNDKIALDFFPQKMKLIRFVPHVDARTFDGVLLGFGVVGCRAFHAWIAHILVVVKYAQFVLRDQVEWKNAECEKEYCFHVVLFIVVLVGSVVKDSLIVGQNEHLFFYCP